MGDIRNALKILDLSGDRSKVVISGLNKLSTTHEVEWTYSFTILGLALEVSVQLHRPPALPPRKQPPVANG
jgi:hypothetical protein